MGRKVDRSVVAELMRRMAAGDSTAVFELLVQNHDNLARTVCGILHSFGRRDVAARRVDVDYLVQGAALVLFDRAGGWRSDGALPWVWAYASIRAEIVAWLGNPSVEFDPQLHVANRCDSGSSQADVDLGKLASEHCEIAKWVDAVREVASERDQSVHLEYQIQKHVGDRSPAQTISAMFGLSAANVRQIDARVRRRITDRHFDGELSLAL